MLKYKEWIISAVIVCLFLLSSVLLLLKSPPTNSSNPEWMGPAVGLISINGPISGSSSNPAFGPDGSDAVLAELEALVSDPRVKAIVLRINSPGGTVGASQEISQAITRIRTTLKKPVIVSISDMGTSGAYWIAMSGSKIVANPGSIVGSIGVIMQNMDFTEVPRRYGIDNVTYKSGKYKDMLSSWRPASLDEKKLIQGVLDDIHDQFITTLIERRGIPTPNAITIAQGQVFSGRQALDYDLIDYIGNMEFAISLAAKEVGIKGRPPIVSKAQPSFGSFLTKILRLASAVNPLTNTPSIPR